ncbi:trimethylamine methyltransferase family protein, partial [Tateyamaria sp.]
MADTEPRRKTRGGGRAGAAARRGRETIEQMPWNPPIMIDPPVEPLRPEGVEAIHDGAMRILEEIGIQFLNNEALGILREAGCRVDGDMVFMDRDFVMEMVAKAPSEFTITPRNLDRKI